MPRRRIRGCLSALLACAWLGCGVDLPPQTLATAHFRFHVDPGVPFCDGVGEASEANAAALRTWLGVPVDAAPIDVYVLRDDRVGAACHTGMDATGCWLGGAVYSNAPFDAHELMHAYASALGDPPTFFEEGLAQAALCAPWSNDTFPLTSVLPILTDGAFQSQSAEEYFNSYGRAASFVRFLIDRFGKDSFLAVYASVPRGAAIEEIDRAFMSHFGQPAAALDADWQVHGKNLMQDIMLCIPECASPTLATGLNEVEMRCGAHFAPAWNEQVFHADRTLDVLSTDPVRLRFWGPPTADAVAATLLPCDRHLGASLYASTRRSNLLGPGPANQREDIIAVLPPGKYYLSLSGTTPAGASLDTPYSVTLALDASGTTAECAAPLDVGDVQAGAAVWLVPSGSPATATLAVDTGTTSMSMYAVNEDVGSFPTTTTLCSVCGNTGSCTTGPGIPLSPDGLAIQPWTIGPGVSSLTASSDTPTGFGLLFVPR